MAEDTGVFGGVFARGAAGTGGRAGLEHLPAGRQIRLETARDVPHAFGACFSSGPAARGDAQHGVMAMPGLADAAHPPRQPIAQNSRGWPHLYG